MKKILLLLMLMGICFSAQAHQFADSLAIKQAKLKNLKLPLSASLYKEDSYGNTLVFQYALKGDVQAISSLKDVAGNVKDRGAFLLRVDTKTGNNVFHVAKDVQTIQALARLLRVYYPVSYGKKIRQMMNHRNYALETPVHRQINYGRSDSFKATFSYTELYDRIIKVKTKLDRGGLVAETALSEVEEILLQSKDSSGRTIAQAAKANNMTEIVDFFNKNAPYLL